MPLWAALICLLAYIAILWFAIGAVIVGASADDDSDELADQIAHSDLAQLSPLELRAVQSRLGGDLGLASFDPVGPRGFRSNAPVHETRGKE